jgi:hypothetical protein
LTIRAAHILDLSLTRLMDKAQLGFQILKELRDSVTALLMDWAPWLPPKTRMV